MSDISIQIEKRQLFRQTLQLKNHNSIKVIKLEI